MDDPDFLRLARGAPHLSYDEIVRHPRMKEARKFYLDRFLALYGDDPFMARLLIETGRFLVYHAAVVLYAGQDPARRETWFTVGRLKREMAVFGMASDRQIDHLVARLESVGFLTVQRAEQDRRVRILAPTEKMLAHDRAWLAAHYAPLTIVSRFDDYEPVMREDPAYQLMHRQTATEFMPFSGKLLAMAPDLLLFFHHAAGHMVSASLLRAAMEAQDGHAAVPYGDIGERFGVSRTHVRAILNEAQDAGLVRLHSRGGHRVEILDRLWTSYDRGLAAGMFSHDMVHALVTGRKALKRDEQALSAV
ncbi:MAG TPA: hypothetical protein VG986_05665 [Pseudolabrys sp.]|nr:hypothetical protein [Pseudolabrys sp.]